MLFAVTNKKIRTSEPSRFYEDEITATVFGPLAFMSSPEMWSVLHQAGLLKPNSFSDKTPTRHEIKFWPNLRGQQDRKRVQPDLLIEVSFGSKLVRIIVEIKWKSASSSTDDLSRDVQLAHQWVAAKSIQIADEELFQTYLTRSPTVCKKGLVDTNNCDVRFDRGEWLPRFNAITWSDLCQNLQRVRTSNLWMDSIVTFLISANVVPFRGFRVARSMNSVKGYEMYRPPLLWPTIPYCAAFKFGTTGR